jgi:phosphoglycerol transferase MdoB-like AlkP superfamily enzyme
MPTKNLPAAYRYFLFSFAFVLLIFTVYRLGFLAAYALPHLDGAGIREALRAAVRLDLAAAAILVSVIVLFSLPAVLGAGAAPFRRAPAFAGVTTLTLAFVVCVSSFIFYGERGKPLEEEFFMYWSADLFPAVAGAFKAHPWLMILSHLALLLLVVTLAKISRRILSSPGKSFSSRLVRGLSLLFTVLLLFVLIRGVKARPLRSGQVLKSPNIVVNHVAVNPVYNVFVDGLKSFLQRGTYLFYEPAEAIKSARQLLDTNGEIFPDERYPLLRTLKSGRKKRLKNVVVIQLEGFSNGFIGYKRDGRLVAPFLTKLARKHIYFPNFVQNVRFTHRALFVINSSWLDRATARTILKTPEIRHRFSSLGRTLQGQGYAPLYIEGASSDYEDMRGFLTMQGYTIFDGPVMDESGRYDDVKDNKDSFGYHDDLVFDEAVYRFRNAEQPFLGYITTHSTHSPWMPPQYFESRFEKPYGVFEYTDWAVRGFFQSMREAGLLDNTIVIITSDHTSLPVRDLSHFDRMNIPLIIYRKGRPGKVVETIGSQVDILPTVLGLAGIDVPYASMGRDLLRAPRDSGFAASVYNGHAFWHEKDVILQDWLGEGDAPRLFERRPPPGDQGDKAANRPALVKDLQYRLRSYYQAGRILSLEDRVFPPSMD